MAGRKIKLLLIEDNLGDARLIKEELSGEGGVEFAVENAQSIKEALEKIKLNKYDVLLIDLNLPDSSGLETLSKIQSVDSHAPKIVLTGIMDEKIAVEALKKGAQDYLVKGETTDRHLLKAIRYSIERKAIEQALIESFNLYSITTKLSPAGIFRTDKDGKYIFVNEKWEQITGMSLEDVSRLGLEPVLHPEDRAAFAKEWQMSIKKQSPFKSEFRFLSPDGPITWVQMDAIPEKNASGGPESFVGALTDLTELKYNEQKFIKVFENTKSCIVVYEPDKTGEEFTIKEINKAAEKIEKVSRKEVIGKKLTDVFPGVEEFGILEVFRKVFKTGKPEFLPLAQYKDNRVTGWKENYVFKLDSGEIVAVYDDITEQKKAEEALKASEKKLKEAQSMARLGYWIWDVKTGAVEWTEEVYRIFGLDPKEFTPHIDSILSLSPWPEDHERDKELIRKATENHEQGVYEQRFLRPDKSIGYYQSTFQGKYDDEGNLISIIGTVLDTTERKKHEEQICYLNRVYATLSQVNQAIVKSKDTESLFNNICKVAVKYGNFKFAWVGLLDEKSGKVRPAVQYGQDERYLKDMEITLSDKPSGLGTIGRAFSDGKIAVCGNIEKDPGMSPWKKEALKRGFLSFASIPFRAGGKTIGVINLYVSEAEFFTENEIKLLEETGSDISFALDNIEKERQRQSFEKSLQESEEKYRVFFDGAADLIAIVDAKGLFLDLNKKFEEESLWKKEEMLGKSIFTSGIVTKSSAAAIAVHLANILIGKPIPIFEVEGVKKNGDTVPYELRAIPIKKDNRIVSIQAILRNLSERKKTETALKVSEERYRKAQKIGHIGNWEYNIETAVLWGSDEAKEIFGFEPDREAFLLNEVENCIPERERVHQALVDLIEKGKEYDLEYDILTKDKKQTKTILSVAEVENNKDGKPVKITGLIIDITARKKAEEALRASEEKYRTIIENTRDMIYVFDADGTVAFISPQVEQYGYKPEEIIGRNLLEFVHPEDRETIAKDFEKTIMTGSIFPSVARLRKKDGSYVYIEDFGQLVSQAGSAPKITGTIRDISERKQAEDLLKKSEEKYKSIVDNSSDQIFMLDREGRYLSVNKRIAEMLGKTVNEMLGKSVSEIFEKETAAQFMKNIIKVFETGSGIAVEEKMVINDNEIYSSTSLNPIKDDKGNVTAVTGIVRDITERKKAAEILLQSEKKYREIFENAVEGIYRSTPEGRYMDVNPAFAKMGGYATPKEMIDEVKDIRKLYVDPVQRERIKQLFEQEGTVRSFVIEFYKKNGETGWMSINGKAFKGEDGKVLYYEGTAEDVTEAKRNREELDKKIADLERFNKVAVGRELKMAELKTKIRELEKRLAEKK